MISIQNLSFSYPKKDSLFHELNWECSDGSIIGLLGKNGAGKSTFLRLLSGLIFPKNGEVKVGLQNPRDRQPDFLKDIFLIPDELAIPIHLKVSDYTKMMAPFYPQFDCGRFETLLREFEIEENAKLGDFSFGQQKKVVLAFGLSTNCKFLLFDEPTNGLDIPSKFTFRKAVAANLGDQQTLIIATHLVKDVENLIDRVVILGDGKVKLDEDLLALSDQLNFGYSVEMPETAIYSEKGGVGLHFIQTRQENQNQSQVNLELLFNAVVSGAISVQTFLNQNQSTS
jgi:ABC-2 type transport system ATP-binding protein